MAVSESRLHLAQLFEEESRTAIMAEGESIESIEPFMHLLAEIAISEPMPRSWVQLALCRNKPHVSFFPERGETLDPARLTCAECPVRQQCLDHALKHDIQHGIWGGMSARERKRIGASDATGRETP